MIYYYGKKENQKQEDNNYNQIWKNVCSLQSDLGYDQFELWYNLLPASWKTTVDYLHADGVGVSTHVHSA